MVTKRRFIAMIDELVWIRWHDAASPVNGWVGPNYMGSISLFDCFTVGFVYSVDAESVTFYNTTSKENGDDSFSGVILIPFKCITSWGHAKLGKKEE